MNKILNKLLDKSMAEKIFGIKLNLLYCFNDKQEYDKAILPRFSKTEEFNPEITKTILSSYLIDNSSKELIIGTFQSIVTINESDFNLDGSRNPFPLGDG